MFTNALGMVLVHKNEMADIQEVTKVEREGISQAEGEMQTLGVNSTKEMID